MTTLWIVGPCDNCMNATTGDGPYIKFVDTPLTLGSTKVGTTPACPAPTPH